MHPHFIEATLSRPRLLPGNHALISFIEVTDACKEMGHLNSTCPLAELWISTLSLSNGLSPSTSQHILSRVSEAQETKSIEKSNKVAATASPRARYTESFRYTNGESPYRLNGSGGRESRAVVETYGATISFNENLCWYLDSTFCSYFHELKNLASPSMVLLVGRILIWGSWSICVFAILVLFLLVVRRARCKRKGERIAHIFEELATWSLLLTTLRLIGVLAPPIFYATIFLPCWECFDFEGAAAHEVGHVLGLSHPDRSPLGTTGLNLIHERLAKGVRFDGESCLSPWGDVRVDAAVGSDGHARPTVMKSFSQHTPRVCLQQDDLEALQTLYPDCDTGLATPVCYKTVQNIGWVRLAVYILLPTLACLAFIVALGHFCQRRTQRKLKQARGEVHSRNQQISQFSRTIDGLQRENLDLHASITRMSASEMVRVETKARALTKKLLALQHDSSASNRGSSKQHTEGSVADGTPESPSLCDDKLGSPQSRLQYLQQLASRLPFSPRSPRSRNGNSTRWEANSDAEHPVPGLEVEDRAVVDVRSHSPDIGRDPYFASERISGDVEECAPRPPPWSSLSSSISPSPAIVPWACPLHQDAHAATMSLVELRIARLDRDGLEWRAATSSSSTRQTAAMSVSFS